MDLAFAASGAEVVAAFEAAGSPPDIIFMDISMPGMDGREAARRIRAIEERCGLSRTPIIAMTAHVLPGDAEDILGAGLDGYLAKPMNKARIAEHLEGVRARLAGSTQAEQAQD